MSGVNNLRGISGNRNLIEFFKKCDKDNNGYVTKEELQKAGIELPEADYKAIAGEDGKISISELQKFVQEKGMYVNLEHIQKVAEGRATGMFGVTDRNQDGKISKDEAKGTDELEKNSTAIAGSDDQITLSELAQHYTKVDSARPANFSTEETKLLQDLTPEGTKNFLRNAKVNPDGSITVKGRQYDHKGLILQPDGKVKSGSLTQNLLANGKKEIKVGDYKLDPSDFERDGASWATVEYDAAGKATAIKAKNINVSFEVKIGNDTYQVSHLRVTPGNWTEIKLAKETTVELDGKNARVPADAKLVYRAPERKAPPTLARINEIPIGESVEIGGARYAESMSFFSNGGVERGRLYSDHNFGNGLIERAAVVEHNKDGRLTKITDKDHRVAYLDASPVPTLPPKTKPDERGPSIVANLRNENLYNNGGVKSHGIVTGGILKDTIIIETGDQYIEVPQGSTVILRPNDQPAYIVLSQDSKIIVAGKSTAVKKGDYVNFSADGKTAHVLSPDTITEAYAARETKENKAIEIAQNKPSTTVDKGTQLPPSPVRVAEAQPAPQNAQPEKDSAASAPKTSAPKTEVKSAVTQPKPKDQPVASVPNPAPKAQPKYEVRVGSNKYTLPAGTTKEGDVYTLGGRIKINGIDCEKGDKLTANKEGTVITKDNREYVSVAKQEVIVGSQPEPAKKAAAPTPPNPKNNKPATTLAANQTKPKPPVEKPKPQTPPAPVAAKKPAPTPPVATPTYAGNVTRSFGEATYGRPVTLTFKADGVLDTAAGDGVTIGGNMGRVTSIYIKQNNSSAAMTRTFFVSRPLTTEDGHPDLIGKRVVVYGNKIVAVIGNNGAVESKTPPLAANTILFTPLSSDATAIAAIQGPSAPKRPQTAPERVINEVNRICQLKARDNYLKISGSVKVELTFTNGQPVWEVNTSQIRVAEVPTPGQYKILTEAMAGRTRNDIRNSILKQLGAVSLEGVDTSRSFEPIIAHLSLTQ